MYKLCKELNSTPEELFKDIVCVWGYLLYLLLSIVNNNGTVNTCFDSFIFLLIMVLRVPVVFMRWTFLSFNQINVEVNQKRNCMQLFLFPNNKRWGYGKVSNGSYWILGWS
jgi:hypothetical protein